jgi:hypothetical protein
MTQQPVVGGEVSHVNERLPSLGLALLQYPDGPPCSAAASTGALRTAARSFEREEHLRGIPEGRAVSLLPA